MIPEITLTNGKKFPWEKYKHKKILVINVASE